MHEVELESKAREEARLSETRPPLETRVPRVLIVDDSSTNIVLAKACLKSESLTCETACDGEQALIMARDNPPDLILLDIMLPGMDGFQVCEQLKSDPCTRHIPVLMITALQDLDDKIRGLRSGAEDFISKPFNRAELQARVRSLLRMKFLQEEALTNERLRVRFQMSQEADRLKDAFVSIVSHELKTPLTVMKGYISLLKAVPSKDDDMTERIIEGLDISMGELEGLLKQLLDFSSMRSGLVTLHKVEVPVERLLNRIFERVLPMAEERKLQIHLDCRDCMPIHADEEKLDSAFHQLIVNAVNFTQPGGQIWVRSRDLGDSVEVVVQDTGIGIPAEDLNRIFDPFFQVAHYLTRKVEGMGIGLSMVKHIVEDHGGRIEVKSEVDAGTSFWVQLPRSLQDVREILRSLREQLQAIQQHQPNEFPLHTDDVECRPLMAKEPGGE